MRIILCFLALFASTNDALRCWTCQNQPSNEDCLLNGRMQECLPNQQECQNEVRRDEMGGEDVIVVAKRCKQDHACTNNVDQNAQGQQCNFRLPLSTCRCCCRSDLCNIPFIGCHADPPEPPPTCRLISSPRFGRRVCEPSEDVNGRTRRTELDVRCTFICNEGYIRRGPEFSTCVRGRQQNTAVFDQFVPRCLSQFCNPPRFPPRNGNVECTNGNIARSICTYTCNDGYALRGRAATRCGLNNRWSRPPPTCVPIQCIPAHRNPLRGMVSCTNGNNLGSVCRFTCRQGYLLEGTATSECRNVDGIGVIGLWTSPPPVCLRIRCNPPHVDPANGEVSCTNGNEESSVCSFTCNDGYFLDGSATSTCLDDGDNDDDGFWSEEPPSCVRIVCNPPQSAPMNGGVSCSNANFFGSVCSFTCNLGFFRDGSVNTRCVDDGDDDADGVWNRPPPSCVQITCQPMQTNPVNGDVSCTNLNIFGSTCRFECQDGYALNGVGTIRCQNDNDNDADGAWSAPPPTCALVSCNPPHTNPQNGRVDCTNANNFASECTFTCNDGFFLSGSSRSVCQDDRDGDTDGAWSSPAATCVRVTCTPEYTDPQNGNVNCLDSNNLGSVCTFTCNAGYFIMGSTTATCNDDNDGDALGEWSSPPAICRRVLCMPPYTDLENGDVSCTNVNNEGSRCTFTCIDNFFLSGSGLAVCEDDLDGDEEGRWSAPIPVCVQVTCVPPRTDPTNGNVRCTNGNNAGSVCSYTCAEGYYLSDQERAATTCRDDQDGDALGEWSQPPPTCLRITCNPEFSDPANGGVTCTDANNFGSRCDFTCSSGFFLEGQTVSICGDDANPRDSEGAWSSPAPVCVRVSCNPPHANPENGGVNCTNSNFVGSVCTFTCNDGFFLDGESSTSTCVDDDDGDADGVWTSVAPRCVRISCQPPHNNPRNGLVRCTDENYLASECTFSCNDGFFLNGEMVSVCIDDDDNDADGVWNNPAPFCAAIVCTPAHEAPENGNLECTDGNVEDSVCSFTCDDGYFLDGVDESTCVDDNDGDNQGMWTSEAPRCLRVICDPAHTNPENGFVTCTDGNNEGSVCSFTCMGSFFLDGSATSTCINDEDGDQLGQWSTPAPTCVRIRCLPAFSNPTSGEVECTDENYHGSSCTFTCQMGFFLNGERMSICMDEVGNDAIGDWSNNAPTCVRITCDPPHRNPQNGVVDCTDGNNLLSECTFRCNDGFFLNGQSNSECIDDFDSDADGVWTSPAPVCVQITCTPAHMDPVSGSVTCSRGNLFGSVCNFTCNDGFFLTGEEQSTCEDQNRDDADGEWSSPAPTCALIVCLPSHESPENGEMECSNFNNLNSVCEFTCNTGFALIGEDTSTCRDDEDGGNLGVWTSDAPTCTQIRCNPVQVNPQDGRVTCTNMNFAGSTCSFTCDEGFFLTGPQQVTCGLDADTSSGVWSNNPPTCVQIVCLPSYESLENGDVGCQDANNAGSVCGFECVRGYALIGAEQAICVDDDGRDMFGRWTNPLPRCQRVACQPPNTEIANGMVDCTDFNFLDSICTFTCNGNEFELNGESETICVESDTPGEAEGFWTFPPPTCDERMCGDPPPPPSNGVIVCTEENLLGSVCEYACEEYHTRVGILLTTCIEAASGDLVWDNPAPTCEPNVCPMQELENGRVECSTMSLIAPTTCTFICNDMYNLFPPDLSINTCQNDSTWNTPPPCCARQCPPLAVIDLVMIMDASSTVNIVNWGSMVSLVGNITEAFEVGPGAARIGLFSYSNRIDTRDQILLNRFTSPNKRDLLQAIQEYRNNFRVDAEGTITGAALSHALDTFFQARNGDRPNAQNVILLLTDGQSEDSITSVSNRLREQGVLVYVVGIFPRFGVLDVEELNQIAGDPERVILATEGFDSLDERFAMLLADELCPLPCQ